MTRDRPFGSPLASARVKRILVRKA